MEINTTFHRPHKPETFARWAAAVHEGFRFAVKLPKVITHERRLVDVAEPLHVFLDAIGPLQDRLGPLLVQLPPSLFFEAAIADGFLKLLRARFSGVVTLEPRHPTWFEVEAERLLADHQVARAAADPARVPAAANPGGWNGVAYFRLHGSPHMYRSDYEAAFLKRIAGELAASSAAERWCIFDNTTLGAATGNALALSALVAQGSVGL